MGVSHQDFFRLLPGAMGEHSYTISGNEIVGEVHGGRVHISIGPEQQRRLTANMALPYCRVTFRYEGLSAADYDRFKQKFDLSFQRGGG